MSAIILSYFFATICSLIMAFLYVLWILLNVALAIGLLAGWYRCLQLFTRHYNRSASIALCIVTLMTCRGSRESFEETGHLTAIAQSDLAINRSVYDDRNLLDLPLTHLSQRIWLHPPAKPGDSIHVVQSVSLAGWQTGLHWQPIDVSVSPRPGRRIQYDVVGTLGWRLLNTTLYTQALRYSGLVAVDTLPSRR